MTAKLLLTSNSIISSLSNDKQGDKPKCQTCNKSHPEKCLNIINSAPVNKTEGKICPVYEEGMHKYKNKAGEEKISKRVKDCPSFKAAGEEQKQALIKK